MYNFKHCVPLHINYTDPRSDLYIAWCEQHLGKQYKDWEWQWYDGGQHGWHEFYFKDQEDMLVFKIVHGV